MNTALFPTLPKPKARRRILATCIDSGALDIVVPGKTVIGNFVHEKCGFDEWIPCTATEARRGIPCPKCNPAEATCPVCGLTGVPVTDGKLAAHQWAKGAPTDNEDAPLDWVGGCTNREPAT